TVDKGSVTVNGVSLTVCEPTDNAFTVAIIPYTREMQMAVHTLHLNTRITRLWLRRDISQLTKARLP
ncbi:hypothetical protein HT105_24530, partial [Bacteroides fragilis]|nr:hypothetical protein [Bacteroides fragilis]